jgi:hypothetical protein
MPEVMVMDALGATRAFTLFARDEAGARIQGVLPEWSVEDPTVATASSDGRIEAHRNGTTTVRARVGDLEVVATIEVEQVPRRVEPVRGENQRMPAGSPLPEPVTVRVTDRLGSPTPGVTAILEPSHGGAVSSSSLEVDADGVATAHWILGPEPGTQQLAITVGGRHTFHLLAEAEDEAGRVPFRIGRHLLSEAPPEVVEILDRAIARWEGVFLEKLPPVYVRVGEGRCGANAPALNEVVDDLLILVTLEAMDGSGGVVAEANPCFLREEGLLPVVGQLRLDLNDLDALLDAGLLQDVLVHEIAHVLGVGSLWELFDLLRHPSLPDAPGADTHFEGPRAIEEFDDLGGRGYPRGKVPVENELGEEGTRDRHWRQSVLGNELLTGLLDPAGPNPLSLVTLGSLEDLGYVVDLGAADPWTLEQARAPALDPERPFLRIRHRETRTPLHVLGVDGRPVRIIPR